MVSFDGGSASKVDDVTALPSRHKMADMLLWQRYNKIVAMRYYGNVMTMSQHSDDVSCHACWLLTRRSDHTKTSVRR